MPMDKVDHNLIRRIWRSETPASVMTVRMSVSRNRTALPTTPKAFEIRTLELLEDVDHRLDSARCILAELWLILTKSKDWYIGDATDEDWQAAYEAIDRDIEGR